MLGSSQDLLYIVLAFCVLWLTIFLCWALYYLISILRDLKWTVEETREKVQMVGKLVDSIEEKVHSSGTYVAMGMRALMQFIDHVREKRTEKEGGVGDVIDAAIDEMMEKGVSKKPARKSRKDK